MSKTKENKELIDNLATIERINIHEAFVNAAKEFRQPNFNVTVDYNKVNFQYANLAEILDCVTKPLLKHGLCLIHDFYNENNVYWLKTYLRYVTGETLGNVVFPIAITGKEMQKIGAQITYSKRYAVAMLCNLCADEDKDDGKAVSDDIIIKKITPEQVAKLKELTSNNSKEINKKAWRMIKEVYSCTDLEDILDSQYDGLVVALKMISKMEDKNDSL